MKIKCLFNHRFLKVKECIRKDYENDDEEITVYYCKYCGKAVLVRTRCIKSHFKSPENLNFGKVEDCF